MKRLGKDSTNLENRRIRYSCGVEFAQWNLNTVLKYTGCAVYKLRVFLRLNGEYFRTWHASRYNRANVSEMSKICYPTNYSSVIMHRVHHKKIVQVGDCIADRIRIVR